MNYLDILVRASIDVTGATENIKLPNAGTQVRGSPLPHSVRGKLLFPLPHAHGLRMCCSGMHFLHSTVIPIKENSDNVLGCCYPKLYFNRIIEKRSESRIINCSAPGRLDKPMSYCPWCCSRSWSAPKGGNATTL